MTVGEMKDDTEIELEYILEDLKERFPEDIRVDGVVVVDDDEALTAEHHHMKGVSGVEASIIKINRDLAEPITWKTKSIILHELVHAYIAQHNMGHISDNDPLFHWLCGRVMAANDLQDLYNHEYTELALPFVKQEEDYPY